MEGGHDLNPRVYTIKRDPQLGYGFILGLERPCMVKLIEPNGPTFGLLKPYDVILAINGIDVENAPLDQVTTMVRLCDQEIDITVRRATYAEQIRATNRTDPRFFMSLSRPSKKNNNNRSENEKPLLRRSNTMRLPPKVAEIFKNVIKIFYEDGRKKVLQFNQTTTVGDILETLNSTMVSNKKYSDLLKLYFGLAVTVESDDNAQDPPASSKKPLHKLDEDHPIMGISKLPYAKELIVLYRMIYFPADIFELYNQDKVVFEYLYKQSCNDLKLERFSPPITTDIAIKLSALFLIEYVHSNLPKAHGNSKDPKIYVKLVEKDPDIGLEYFLPKSMVKATKDKKGERLKSQYKRLKARVLEQLKKSLQEIISEPQNSDNGSIIKRLTSTSFHDLTTTEPSVPICDQTKLLFLDTLKELPCTKHLKQKLPNSINTIYRNSTADCSSSMESVPQTSDSSPLIRQARNKDGYTINNGRFDQTHSSVVTRQARMNSMRSLNSLQTIGNGTINGNHSTQAEPEMAQTPSIESISSITFNMQSTPSPQQILSSHLTPRQADLNYSMDPVKTFKQSAEPSPLPRQMSQSQVSRSDRYNSIEKLYSQRYMHNGKTIDDLLRTAVISPPPPVIATLFHEPTTRYDRDRFAHLQSAYLTPIISDRELASLRVPPPPK